MNITHTGVSVTIPRKMGSQIRADRELCSAGYHELTSELLKRCSQTTAKILTLLFMSSDSKTGEITEDESKLKPFFSKNPKN